MSEVDFIQAVMSVQADIDGQFQFWLSITFAALVASFVAGDRLPGRARVLMVLMYLVASVLLFRRYLRGMDYFQHVMQLYTASGFIPPPPRGGLLSTAQLRWGLWVLGSLISAVVLLFPRLGVRHSHSHDA